MSTCKARVPDNGDCYQCGGLVERGGFCHEHAKVESKRIRENIAKHEAKITELVWKLDDLGECR